MLKKLLERNNSNKHSNHRSYVVASILGVPVANHIINGRITSKKRKR